MLNKVKWSFAFGHIFNDICASMWFFYSMPYLVHVVKLNNELAGIFLFVGQIADAISTPLIGIESDRKGIICGKKVGKRKSWNLLATILVALSFPFLFNNLFPITVTPKWYLIVYYAPLVVIFQFGWATSQVTHLSLIPVLIQEGQDNHQLNSLRYIFTVLSNIGVMVSTTLLFGLNKHDKVPCPDFKNSSALQPGLTLTPCDQDSFTYLSIGFIIVGLFFSTLFHLGVPEKKSNYENDENYFSATESTRLLPINRTSQRHLSRSAWFKKPQFYLVNMLYLGTRLIVNVSQVYLILFIGITWKLPKIYGPLGALTTFISGSVTSLILKYIQKKVGAKFCYLVGVLFIGIYCTSISFPHDKMIFVHLYISMAVLGIGCSLIMVGSLSLTAEMIGDNCSSSAFVYGTMSFSDKLFNGIAYLILQNIAPSKTCSKSTEFYYNVQFYFIGGCAIFVLIIWIILYPVVIAVKCNKQQQQQQQQPQQSVNAQPE